MKHPGGVLARAALAGVPLLASCRAAALDEPRPWRDAALGTARWLESVAQPTGSGLAWAAVSAESAEPVSSLYAGAPGVVLFFLELGASTGDEHWLGLARAGADELLAGLPAPDTSVADEAAGLYTGIAGVGFTLGEVWRVTHDGRYRAGLEHCVALLDSSAQTSPSSPGVAWSTNNDVIAGTAGIGFFLTWAAEALDASRPAELARLAGARLESLGEPVGPGLDWPMDPGYPRRMPNFAHGTAGIAAFLARLGRTEPAVRGADYLLSIADRSDGFRVYHHTPDGTDLFYYGWCHGPCGTARLFRELELAEGAARWRELELQCARAVEVSGLPERRLAGFWDNVSRCCGSASVIELFVELHEHTRDPAALEFARRVAADLVARGTRDEHGLRWIQAEHRVQPELLQAQTGLMQGASGIGLALLHLDAAEHGRAWLIVLPDEPR